MPEPQVKTLEIKSVNDKYKEASDKQKAKDKAESFRKDEEKGLSKSMGTAGPKESVDMSSGGDDDKQKVTDKQKEEFREQEETYLTKSPGTAGDKYYKNPEGTGTGQGGSGIPVTSSDSSSTPTVAPTVTTTPTVTPTVDPVDMSSGGDEEARYSSSASSPVSGTGGGQATDIEEIPDLPNKLRSAIRRRRTRKLGKRGLRNTSSQTGLNIPAGNSGLGIPT